MTVHRRFEIMQLQHHELVTCPPMPVTARFHPSQSFKFPLPSPLAASCRVDRGSNVPCSARWVMNWKVRRCPRGHGTNLGSRLAIPAAHTSQVIPVCVRVRRGYGPALDKSQNQRLSIFILPDPRAIVFLSYPHPFLVFERAIENYSPDALTVVRAVVGHFKPSRIGIDSGPARYHPVSISTSAFPPVYNDVIYRCHICAGGSPPVGLAR